jgi:hypothetical protein
MFSRFERKTFVSLFAAVMALLLFGNAPAFAQVSGATLTGTVTDASGAQVPDVKIVIKDVATGIERTVTTNKDGFYIAANLLPSEYRVTVSATGFNTEVKSGIKLNVGARRNASLSPWLPIRHFGMLTVIPLYRAQGQKRIHKGHLSLPAICAALICAETQAATS